MEGLIDRRIYGEQPDNFAELTCKKCGVKQWHAHPKTRMMSVINAVTKFKVCTECDRMSGYAYSKIVTPQQLTLFT